MIFFYQGHVFHHRISKLINKLLFLIRLSVLLEYFMNLFTIANFFVMAVKNLTMIKLKTVIEGQGPE